MTLDELDPPQGEFDPAFLWDAAWLDLRSDDAKAKEQLDRIEAQLSTLASLYRELAGEFVMQRAKIERIEALVGR